jgi:hypothetical protein
MMDVLLAKGVVRGYRDTVKPLSIVSEGVKENKRWLHENDSSRKAF